VALLAAAAAAADRTQAPARALRGGEGRVRAICCAPAGGISEWFQCHIGTASNPSISNHMDEL